MIQEFIQNETKNIIFNCCNRYAKENSLDIVDVQLVMFLKVEGEGEETTVSNGYQMYKKYEPKELFTFKQILGVKIDFKGYGHVAQPFIVKSLVKIAQENAIPFDKVNAMCIAQDKNDVQIFIYNDMKQFIKKITIEDLIGSEE